MATRSYTSRRELEEYHFSPFVTVLAPLVLIFLQAYLPKVFPRLLILDLPLIAVIFFSVSRRSPIAGSLTGAAIGLFQDLLTHQPIGVNGMAKTVIGYAASSIGVQVDVENLTTRILMNFAFSLLQSVLLFLINRNLLGVHGYKTQWVHELIRAGINTGVAIPLFLVLDRFKQHE
ncbi:rod shape-determining protein MreD [Granulicella tundricola]|uniref:Rod shape-determining protein MreD n=1 Tax=Granulicella tundricola (strain ATCC BAA-1859 / DSM 23138 / MP5ACTX9) TaxID=1198114 RepID=E8X1N9_GRATM|nr:rod shape-determining protein MreD [Granulicella tundricola]ADW67958.1 rod shape-determining protein MreD [Granulicella tundricola MP5ACTX9]